ncbi:uncharacterized protein LOC133804477 [Humulus lupulus]|uniref:uncharacterized protein LOC133804477 n=1 Tax=Humulus lupulus TaxID=3486 RepID=UPI002B405DD6|nr:uncharacterized protein LOC133804477 [Humulus lupulus]
MENMLRRSKDAILGHGRRRNKTIKPATVGRCKKHPKHHQSPGVCSLCLSNKLSQLKHMNPKSFSRRTSTTTGSGSSSTTSSLSSYYSSEDDDDVEEEEEYEYCRNRYEGKRTASFLLSGNNMNNVLKKSRSLAFVSRNKDARSSSTTTSHDHDEKRSGGGFWSKLINPKANNNNKRSGISRHRDEQGPKFMHSRTVGERSVLHHQLVY